MSTSTTFRRKGCGILSRRRRRTSSSAAVLLLLLLLVSAITSASIRSSFFDGPSPPFFAESSSASSSSSSSRRGRPGRTSRRNDDKTNNDDDGSSNNNNADSRSPIVRLLLEGGGGKKKKKKKKDDGNNADNKKKNTNSSSNANRNENKNNKKDEEEAQQPKTTKEKKNEQPPSLVPRLFRNPFGGISGSRRKEGQDVVVEEDDDANNDKTASTASPESQTEEAQQQQKQKEDGERQEQEEEKPVQTEKKKKKFIVVPRPVRVLQNAFSKKTAATKDDDEKLKLKEKATATASSSSDSGNVTATTSSSTTATTSSDEELNRKNATVTTTATAPSSETNETANATAASSDAQQQQQQQLPPKGTSLIVIGSPGSATGQRYYRRQIPGGGILPPPEQQQQNRHAQTLSQNYLLLIELAASVLATLTRLWMLRWLAGWIAKQEESMQPTQHFVFERLNDRYVRDASALQTAIQAPPDGVSHARWRRKHVRPVQGRVPDRHHQHEPPHDLKQMFTRTVVVVEMKTDNKDGPDNQYLEDIISFLIQQHRRKAFGVHKDVQKRMELEVVLLVQSPGGSVSSFGLAAAQVQRLSNEDGITTTVCVDQYAASGGYMIASQAHNLLASKFATVGSVGVIMEGLNFHDVAKRYGIQPLVIKAGESKNPFTTFGPVSRQDIQQETARLEKVHQAFRALIVEGRPALEDSIDQIADGSVFIGSEALGLKLVDRVVTSSQYLLERVEAGDRVLKLHRTSPSRFHRRTVGLSPIDILPHLRAWISNKMRIAGDGGYVSPASSPTDHLSWLIQTGTALSFLSHLYSQYFRHERRR